MSEPNKTPKKGLSNNVKDVIALAILLAFMLFVCLGVPELMGGAQDSSGNPLTVSFVQTLSETLI